MKGFMSTSKAKPQPKKRQRTSAAAASSRSARKDRSAPQDSKSSVVLNTLPMDQALQKLEQITAAVLWNGTLKEKEIDARLQSASQSQQLLIEAGVLGTSTQASQELCTKLEERI